MSMLRLFSLGVASRATLGFLGSLALVAACGDDDGPGMDAGGDAGGDVRNDMGNSDGPRRDAPMTDGPRTDGPTDGGGGMCPEAECDLITGSGCPAGMACYYASPNPGDAPRVGCFQAGNKGDGEACSAINECEDGFFCFIRAEGEMGICRHYCCGSASVCPNRAQLCNVTIGPGILFCDEPDTCNVVEQTGCEMEGAGAGCYLVTNDGALRCLAPTANKMQGETCGTANECAPGFVCLGSMAGNQCQRFCDTTDCGADAGADCPCNGLDAPPDGGMRPTCRPLNIAALPNVGTCR